jgi:hypothetical protein
LLIVARLGPVSGLRRAVCIARGFEGWWYPLNLETNFAEFPFYEVGE